MFFFLSRSFLSFQGLKYGTLAQYESLTQHKKEINNGVLPLVTWLKVITMNFMID